MAVESKFNGPQVGQLKAQTWPKSQESSFNRASEALPKRKNFVGYNSQENKNFIDASDWCICYNRHVESRISCPPGSNDRWISSFLDDFGAVGPDIEQVESEKIEIDLRFWGSKLRMGLSWTKQTMQRKQIWTETYHIAVEFTCIPWEA